MFRVTLILLSMALLAFPSILLSNSHPVLRHIKNTHALTKEEKLFLSKLKVIKKCVDPLWMPLEEINKNGEHVGVIADILHIVEKKIGIPIELVPTQNWPESTQKLNARECDILSSDTIDNTIDKSIKTISFIEDRNVYITRQSTPLQLDFSTIKNKRIGIPRGYPTIELIEKKYGKVNFIEVDSTDEGLLMLSRGELYAFTDLLAICSYSMQRQLLTNLKVAGHLDISIPITMSIRSDMPELVSIFNKVLSDIDKSTINTLYAKWIKVEYNVIMDWKTLIKYLLLAIIALGVILYWMRKLYLLNCKLNKANATLELLNETDALSKMKNRNFVTFQLPLLMKLAHRNKDTLNLAILDIDHFKHLNDTYGHDVGDKCIVAISNKIHAIFHREDDWIIRYGGDEFVVISLGEEKRKFSDNLNFLRDEVANLILDTEENIACSVSIGYIYHPLAPKEWHEGLIADADKKLYEAKQSGRNKIVGN